MQAVCDAAMGSVKSPIGRPQLVKLLFHDPKTGEAIHGMQSGGLYVYAKDEGLYEVLNALDDRHGMLRLLHEVPMRVMRT